MLFFALFTLGYFFGVFTVLAVFPPRTKEIEEQEKDALEPILSIKRTDENEQIALTPSTNNLEISAIRN